MGQHLQNLTNVDKETVTSIPYSELSPLQQRWVDYNVVQGLMTNADGEMHKMTITQFAEEIHVARQTLYDWQKAIPNFWELVQQRTKEIMPLARTQKVVNAIFINATVKLNSEAQKMWMGMYANWQPPSQKHEVAINGVVDLVQMARQRREITEGEVIESKPQLNA